MNFYITVSRRRGRGCYLEGEGGEAILKEGGEAILKEREGRLSVEGERSGVHPSRPGAHPYLPGEQWTLYSFVENIQ